MNRAARWIDDHAADLAAAMTELQYQRMPELAERWGAPGRSKCEADARFHLEHLSAAVAHGAPAMFVDYVAWTRALLEGFGIKPQDLKTLLSSLHEALSERAPEAVAPFVLEPVARALAAFDAMAAPATALDPQAPHAALARRYLDALLAGDRRGALLLVVGAADADVPIRELYLHVFAPVQREIGRLWQMNRVSVAAEHYCTAATQLAIAQLYGRMFDTARKNRRMLATCTDGELHELGVRMVADFFEMDGWDTHYLGASVPKRSIITAAVAWRVELIAISATMAKQVRALAELIAAIRSEPQLDHVPIIVGGPPFVARADLWATIGADGSAPDAEEAVALGNRLLGGKP